MILLVLAGALAPGRLAVAQEDSRAQPSGYAGIFVGAGRPDSRIVDIEGFANWGHPGWAVDYAADGFLAGALAGRKLEIAGLPLRVEIDAMFGDLDGSSNQLDPAGLDETAESKFLWTTTAKLGVEVPLGHLTVFFAGGAAAARIDNLAIDVDFGPGRPTRPDPDDSFRDRSIHLGWILAAGLEFPLADDWMLRLEGANLDFGEETYEVNHSGDGRCGPGGERRPCPYSVDNRLRLVRLAITRPFGR